MSKQELKTMFEGIEQKDEEMWEQVFEEVDLDKDGFISIEEFMKNMRWVINTDSAEIIHPNILD
jgi:Ca2+-binding EF-hand superfamily protein